MSTVQGVDASTRVGDVATASSEDGREHAVVVEKIAPEMAGQEFAVGLYMSMWPKVEKCDQYVSMLLETQEQLHHKIKALTETLTGAKDGRANLDESQSPLVDYAVRLRGFPNRVQVLQQKLEGIRSLLNAVKASQLGSNPTTPVKGSAPNPSTSIEAEPMAPSLGHITGE
ncbi:hypothetical protein DYB32_002533 [Aphanomyces invadans]|uniref:Biogenesis of lysosome-related organelles complex 1 subunit 7 n=1 Tax=Aphanomyces invadans TaxID=157072 RepID=A0A418B323_9STRA|nr:hypothetical protein DYB32_002533 [Aphanomyces invadans]